MRQKCFYEFIDNYLAKNNVQLNNINIDPNYGGQAGVSSTGNLTFWNSDEINSHNLSHEWIHLFQKQYNSMSSFGDKRGMMEFELALTQDILKFIEIGGKWKTTAYSWACWGGRNEKYRDEYMTWLMNITQDGKSYPSAIDNNKFQYFSHSFGEVSISYSTNRGYTYGNISYNSSAIQSLFNQAKNHCNK